MYIDLWSYVVLQYLLLIITLALAMGVLASWLLCPAYCMPLSSVLEWLPLWYSGLSCVSHALALELAVSPGSFCSLLLGNQTLDTGCVHAAGVLFLVVLLALDQPVCACLCASSFVCVKLVDLVRCLPTVQCHRLGLEARSCSSEVSLGSETLLPSATPDFCLALISPAQRLSEWSHFTVWRKKLAAWVCCLGLV